MQSTDCKRKPCADISNVGEDKNHKSCKYSAEDMFPMNVTTLAGEKAAASVSFEVQNVHPALATMQAIYVNWSNEQLCRGEVVQDMQKHLW